MGLFQTVFHGSDEMYFKAEEELNKVIAELGEDAPMAMPDTAYFLACIYAYLGKKYLVKSIISMAVIAFVLDVIYPHVPAYTGDPLLAALFAGVISGVGLALIYARGYCTGGSDFIIMAIRKKFPHLSVGSITLLIDGAIILAGGFVFGRVDAVLQGIVMTAANGICFLAA